MNKNVLSQYDVAERQQNALSQALTRPKNPTAPVPYIQTGNTEHITATPLRDDSTRDKTRILFISRDEGLLSGAPSIDGYLNLGEVFDEVHIVLLRTGGVPVRFPLLRMSNRVWLYIAHAKDWWRAPLQALSVIDEHLVFAGRFRPDIIIAHDPFESGLVATFASKRYGCPHQIHLQHDFYHPKFAWVDAHPYLRRWLAWYVLRQAVSVRTVAEQISQMVQNRFPMVRDVATLPRFNRYEASLDLAVTYDLKQLYPKFAFRILYVGSLNYDNLVHQVIDTLKIVCKTINNVGLIILGAGPAKAELQKRVKRLRLEQHVVFETALSRQTDYLKTADVLIVTDPTSAADELVIQGAVLYTTIIATPTTVRTDLFTNQTSILFFEPGNSAVIASHLLALASDRVKCTLMAEVARQVVQTRLYTDEEAYRYAYRSSIEQVLFISDEVAEVTTEVSPQAL